jgi:hypothetical protein
MTFDFVQGVWYSNCTFRSFPASWTGILAISYPEYARSQVRSCPAGSKRSLRHGQIFEIVIFSKLVYKDGSDRLIFIRINVPNITISNRYRLYSWSSVTYYWVFSNKIAKQKRKYLKRCNSCAVKLKGSKPTGKTPHLLDIKCLPRR